jgi:hypothetical protein
MGRDSIAPQSPDAGLDHHSLNALSAADRFWRASGCRLRLSAADRCSRHAALVIGQDSSMWTAQVALSTFLTAQTINLHELFLAAAVSILPLVLVFIFLQRYLVQGVAETGIKD